MACTVAAQVAAGQLGGSQTVAGAGAASLLKAGVLVAADAVPVLDLRLSQPAPCPHLPLPMAPALCRELVVLLTEQPVLVPTGCQAMQSPLGSDPWMDKLHCPYQSSQGLLQGLQSF
jgi:hypothetical protein